MSNIAGIFDSSTHASIAYTHLIDAGFTPEQMSLAVSREGRDRIFTGGTTLSHGKHDAVKGSIAGAIGVGALSALVGGLTALVIGPGVLAAGPLLVALSSAGAGAAVGGLSGALVEAGFSRDDASRYETELKAGKAVLVVHDVSGAEEVTARIILRHDGAAARTAA